MRPAIRYALGTVGALLLAVTVAACGETTSTSGFKGEAKAVAQTISDFQSDETTGNQQKICSNDVAGSLKTRLQAAGSSCQAAFKSQTAEIDTFGLSVQSVQVNGTTATASVKSTWSGKTLLARMQLVKEGTRWKISGLG